jgi:hypothetical protein
MRRNTAVISGWCPIRNISRWLKVIRLSIAIISASIYRPAPSWFCKKKKNNKKILKKFKENANNTIYVYEFVRFFQGSFNSLILFKLSEHNKLKRSRLKKKFTQILKGGFHRRIHPVQAIMFFAGLLAFVLGVIARFVVNERILKVVLVLLAAVSILALLCIGGIVLTYMIQMISEVIRRNLSDREEYRFFQNPYVDIRPLCRPSGRNLEFASGDEIETPGNAPE